MGKLLLAGLLISCGACARPEAPVTPSDTCAPIAESSAPVDLIESKLPPPVPRAGAVRDGRYVLVGARVFTAHATHDGLAIGWLAPSTIVIDHHADDGPEPSLGKRRGFVTPPLSLWGLADYSDRVDVAGVSLTIVPRCRSVSVPWLVEGTAYTASSSSIVLFDVQPSGTLALTYANPTAAPSPSEGGAELAAR